MADGVEWRARIKADLLWASGRVRLAEARGRGVGALIGFDRVRPSRRDAFQPRRHLDVTPDHLDRLIRALKRWRVDIVSLDDACARLGDRAHHRFVSLSFNGSYRDVATYAYPVLRRHRVPATVYVPSAHPDGIGEPWWLALEAVIARQDRISLVVDRSERHFTAPDAEAKMQLYAYLADWMRGLPAADLTQAMNDLCVRYGIDARALAQESAIGWDDIGKLADDPLVTLGSATVNGCALASLTDEAARRDMMMGRAVLETATRRSIRHFAYPFGDTASFQPKHVEMARAAGFASAVSARSGTLGGQGIDMHDLPRVIWTNPMTLRGLRVRLAGF